MRVSKGRGGELDFVPDRRLVGGTGRRQWRTEVRSKLKQGDREEEWRGMGGRGRNYSKHPAFETIYR